MKINSPDDLEIFQTAEILAHDVWNIIMNWNYFDRNTLGKQFIRAVDSISLNISEGYGRYYYKENKVFCYYARGSLYETKACLNKAYKRKLIEDDIFQKIDCKLEVLLPKLNSYINSIGKSSSTNTDR
jgi:four helix bundle protein